MSSMNWVRHVFGRNPQSVVDFSGSELRHEDSVQVELAANLARPPALPVDADGCTGFQDLPEELLEHIFSYLQGSSRRNHFAV